MTDRDSESFRHFLKRPATTSLMMSCVKGRKDVAQWCSTEKQKDRTQFTPFCQWRVSYFHNFPGEITRAERMYKHCARGERMCGERSATCVSFPLPRKFEKLGRRFVSQYCPILLSVKFRETHKETNTKRNQRFEVRKCLRKAKVH
jgi:hypothetical protein